MKVLSIVLPFLAALPVALAQENTAETPNFNYPPECETNESLAGGTEPICLICPEGQISNDRTNRTVATTSLTCEVWAFAGYCGQIPTDGGACSFVQFATADCNCVDLPSSGPADPADPATPTDAPMAAPVDPVTIPTQAPNFDYPAQCETNESLAGGVAPICSICPEGQISDDKTNVTIAETSLTCEVWSFAGICGQIPSDEGACAFVQFATADCNCIPIPPGLGGTEAPVAPVAAPTEAPVGAPADSSSSAVSFGWSVVVALATSALFQ